MSNRRRLPPAVIDALGEIVAAGVASGMIDRYIPVRDGFIDAAAPGEPARIAAHLAASPDAPEWAAVHEPLATLLRETIRLAAGPPSLSSHPVAPTAAEPTIVLTVGSGRFSAPVRSGRPVAAASCPGRSW